MQYSQARLGSNPQRYIADEDLEQTRGHIEARAGGGDPVLLGTSPLFDGIGGRYFEDCIEAAPTQPDIDWGVAPYALDPEAAVLLWELSTDMLAS